MHITKSGVIVIGLIFISLIVSIGFYTVQHLKDKRHQHSEDVSSNEVNVDRSQEVVSISASELMSHYRKDAYGANKKYSDDSIQPGVPRIPLPPGHLRKSIIVKGKIKRIHKEELAHLGFVNQYKVSVILWGEDSTPHIAKRKEQIAETEAEIESKTRDIEDIIVQSVERIMIEGISSVKLYLVVMKCVVPLVVIKHIHYVISIRMIL